MSAAQYLDRVKGHLAAYDRDLALDRYDLLNSAHEKTGQPRIYLVLGALSVTFILVSAVLGLAFVSNLFAFYPVYSSFKALRSASTADDQFWLTYWTVYGTLTLFESLIDGVFFWLPLYYVLKIALLIWLFHPNSRGALVVYSRFLAPLFASVEARVSEAEKELSENRPPGGASVSNSGSTRASTSSAGSQSQRASTSQKGK